MLWMEQADEDRYPLGVGELGEDDGEVLAAKEIEERTDLRDDVPCGRHFHGLARVEKGPLHIHDDERAAPGLELQRRFKCLRAVHGDRRGPYQAATEKAFGICRIALTPPSSLTTTATTSKRHGCSRRRLSLR